MPARMIRIARLILTSRLAFKGQMPAAGSNLVCHLRRPALAVFQGSRVSAPVASNEAARIEALAAPAEIAAVRTVVPAEELTTPVKGLATPMRRPPFRR